MISFQPNQSYHMSTQRSCSFCHLPGHRINHCAHPSAIELLNTASFKGNIALQYLGTGAEEQMFIALQSWFQERTVTELRRLSYSKGLYPPTGPKSRLVAIALLTYYFYGSERPGRMFQGRRYLTGRFMQRNYYFRCIATGLDAEADGILRGLIAMRNPDEQWTQNDDDDDETLGPEKIPFINGLTEESADCPICFETETKITKTNCGHLFCRPCIMEHTKGITAACPCCRTAIDLFIVK